MSVAAIEKTNVYAGSIFKNAASVPDADLAPAVIRAARPGTSNEHYFPAGATEVYITRSAFDQFNAKCGGNGVGVRFEAEPDAQGRYIATDVCWDIDCHPCSRKISPGDSYRLRMAG